MAIRAGLAILLLVGMAYCRPELSRRQAVICKHFPDEDCFRP